MDERQDRLARFQRGNILKIDTIYLLAIICLTSAYLLGIYPERVECLVFREKNLNKRHFLKRCRLLYIFGPENIIFTIFLRMLFFFRTFARFLE